MKKLVVNKWCLTILIILIYMFLLLLYKDSILYNTDNAFLINRAEQMLNCIKDGNIPFFYYNDFKGVGYGSSFFYGQLTLYPFLPFLLIGKRTFLYFYEFVSLIIMAIGVRSFTKRICEENYVFVSNIYLMGTSFLCCLCIHN